VVADIVRIKAEQKGLSFAVRAAPDLPPVVRADEKRLRQVLLNLLGNAVKFTDHGEITLAVRQLDTADSTVRLCFEVRDSGIELEADQLERIFDPFEQVCDAPRRFGGTGLGLAISRQLVRLMGSDIHVESRPGAGSRFWFELSLPLLDRGPAAPQARPDATGYEGRRRRVLVVDDVPSNRAMLADLLEPMGFDVRHAVDGLDALQQVQRADHDLVLMDIMMPVMDGLEATRRIRQSVAGRALPIIAVSANASSADGQRCVAAGANAFIAKPIDRDRLLEQIGEHLGLHWTDEAPASLAQRHGDALDPLVVPPLAELEVLHRLAMSGNMRSIRERAAHLAALDPRCRAFAERLQDLASAYQTKAILALVKEQLARMGA
jgi:CheY-like chemotaxis protein